MMFKRYGFWLGGLIFAAVLSYSFFSSDQLGKRKPVPPVQPIVEAEVAKHSPKVKVTAGTEIIQVMKYLKCGDEDVVRTKASEKLVGLTYPELQQVYQGWNIETFDTKEIVLHLTVDNYCKTHSDTMFLGIHNGFVAIYYGTPGPKAILKEVTTIGLNAVNPQDREELQKGIIVKDRAELLQTLEGLQEHR